MVNKKANLEKRFGNVKVKLPNFFLISCYSMIGRQGGKQQISLGQGCGYKGVAIHEMMHALGFYHEQSRLDRDNYITINWNNINRSKLPSESVLFFIIIMLRIFL